MLQLAHLSLSRAESKPNGRDNNPGLDTQVSASGNRSELERESEWRGKLDGVRRGGLDLSRDSATILGASLPDPTLAPSHRKKLPLGTPRPKSCCAFLLHPGNPCHFSMRVHQHTSFALAASSLSVQITQPQNRSEPKENQQKSWECRGKLFHKGFFSVCLAKPRAGVLLDRELSNFATYRPLTGFSVALQVYKCSPARAHPRAPPRACTCTQAYAGPSQLPLSSKKGGVLEVEAARISSFLSYAPTLRPQPRV